jgi:type III secretion protein Q
MMSKSRKSASQALSEPLIYSQEFVEISNIIHRKRHPLEWEMEDLTLQLDCSPVPLVFVPTLLAKGANRFLYAHLGQENISICLPLELVIIILDDFGNGRALCEDLELAPLLLTLGLESALDEIEQKLNLNVVFEGLSSSAPSNLNNGLEFSIEVKEQSFKIQVFCELNGLKFISNLLEMSEMAQSELDIKSYARFQIGKTRVTVADLETLEHGDVIVLDNARINTNTVLILVNAGLSFEGHLTGRGTIEVTSQPHQHSIRQHSIMDELDDIDDHEYEHDNHHEEHASHDINLGALQVTLSFELGRQQIAFEDLSSVAQGYTFTLPAHSSGGVTILANGQPIGKGEITKVGEITGVRVTRLFGRGH